MKNQINLRWTVLAILIVGLGIRCGRAQDPVETPSAREIEESDQPSPKSVDDRLVRALTRRLEADEAVPSYRVEVKANDGVVTLSGKVNTLLARDRAAQLAGTIRGVRGVKNEIAVEPGSRTDLQVENDVDAALSLEPVVEDCDIQARVKHGIVTLKGSVKSWQGKNRAEQVAEGVEGVRGVENELKIEYPVNRSDSEIEADVRSRLHWDPWLKNPEPDVAVKAGTVTLSGYVESPFQKQHAHDDAWVMGVLAVNDSAMAVVPNVRAAMIHSEAVLEPTAREHTVTDPEMKAALEQAFAYDTRIVATNAPIVDVRDGLVTLRGTVETLGAKEAAQDIAQTFPGAIGVRNFLKVRSPREQSDADILEGIRRALARDARLEGAHVDASVLGGSVVLSGNADTPAAKEEAEEVAATIPGVQAIENGIEVPGLVPAQVYSRPARLFNGFEPPSDSALLEAVEGQLALDPVLDGDLVLATVRDGVVTLTGTVHSWTERTAAERDAYECGAAGVLNKLKVNSGPRL